MVMSDDQCVPVDTEFSRSCVSVRLFVMLSHASSCDIYLAGFSLTMRAISLYVCV